MFLSIWTSLCLVNAANAELSGPARVIDGDTLEVAGERIRLHGVDAPELSQRCKDEKGKNWHCGDQASNALLEKIGQEKVSCKGTGQDSYGRTIAVCSVSGSELNSWLVEQGWAVAFRRYSTDYVDTESKARSQRVGLWVGSFEMPWEYRARLWDEASNSAPDPNCPIKGNINRKGERIYHTPWGSRSYKRTKIDTRKGERWFCNEAEAVAAGWRAPFR